MTTEPAATSTEGPTPGAKERLAEQLIQQGRLQEAEAIYRSLIAAGSKSPTVYGNLAAICGMQGRSEELIDLLTTAIELNPSNPDAHNNLGNAFRQRGDQSAAIASYTRAIELKDDFPAAHNNLASILRARGQLDQAISSCRQAIRFRPDFADAHHNLGLALQAKGDLDGAIAAFNTGLQHNPENGGLHFYLGLAHYSKQKLSDAIAAFTNAAKLQPERAEPYEFLGHAAQQNGDLLMAIAAYRDAIKLKPNDLNAHESLSFALQEHGDLQAAIAQLNAAIKLIPNNSKLRKNLSLALLLVGDYKQGWENYEWRFRLNEGSIVPHAMPEQPRWDGETLADVNQVLLVSEQGLGDTLQFMRYALALKSQGIAISLCTQPKLHSLIQASGIDAAPLSPEQANQVKDGHWIPLLSVPRHLGVSPVNPIIIEPYIRSTAELVEKWRGILTPEQRPIIAIHWQGNPESEKTNANGRSLPLETFSPLASCTNVTLLSLQKGFGSEQLTTCSFRDRFVSCQPQVDETWDFLETAAIIANCDLVITSDSAVAHLAGGMGRPVWLLLKKVPDWRWGLEGDTSFWYPSMRLFRQTERGNWDGVMQRVVAALLAFVAQHEPMPSCPRTQPVQRLGSPDPSSAIPDSPDPGMQERQAERLIQQGMLNEAEAIYRRIIATEKGNPVAYGKLAAICGMQGKKEELILLLRTAIEINPSFRIAHTILAAALKDQGDLTGAIDAYTKAVALDPHDPEAHNNLGIVLQEQGNVAAATACYYKALELKPDYPDAHNHLGIALEEQGALTAAITAYSKAIQLKVIYPEAYYNMGNALSKQGDLEAAADAYHKAIELKPDYPDAYNNLGILYFEQGDLKEAQAAYNKAIALKPDCLNAHINLGNVLHVEGSAIGAISSFSKAHALEPGNPEAVLNLAIVMLMNGDYHHGWNGYEWRAKVNDTTANPHAQPNCRLWDGSVPIKGDKLILVSEQGLGDTLQFARYAIPLRHQFGQVSICAQANLHSLIQASGLDPSPLTPQQADSATEGSWIPLLSVPRHLAVSPSNPIITEPYINTTEHLISKWQAILADDQRPIIGLNWQGNPHQERSDARGRSLPLESFAPLAQYTSLSLLSLQKGFGSEQLATCSFKERFVSCQPQVDETWDFLETAAIIANCDLVITSDSAVAHLAGGMGRPVWLLLKKVPDWRWGLEGDTSFWYPSMRLFRQTERGNWDEVMQRVLEALHNHFPQQQKHEPLATLQQPWLSEQQAVQLIQQGELQDAEAILRSLITTGVQSNSMYGHLAAVCGMQGNHEEAISLIRQILIADSRDAGAHNILGSALKAKGDPDAAITAYHDAIRINPAFAEAHCNLAVCQVEKGDLTAAIASYEAAIKINPNNATTHTLLGKLHQDRGDSDAAISCFATAIQLIPDHAEARLNLGLCRYEQGDLDSALEAFRDLRNLYPSDPEAHYNLGIVLSELGLTADAIAAYNRAIELKPDNQSARWNLGLAQLTGRDYPSGWEGYEWRSELVYATPKCPRWEGESLSPTERLLVVGEQGLGDILQFMRYVPVVQSMGVSPSLCAPANLHSLIAASGIDPSPLSPEEASQVSTGQWLPLLSLPRHLKVSPDHPVTCEPYIKTTEGLCSKWGALLSREQRPIIAIHWQGNTSHEKRSAIGRSLPLETFSPLASRTNATLLSLQKGFGSEQLATCSFKGRFVSCQDQVDQTWDFLETAAIIANCDLVITSDSAVAHLAGGMGRPVWLLLKQVPDWRWGLEGDTSFWYPSMRLFRQSERGNWDGVMERVVEALNERFPSDAPQMPSLPLRPPSAVQQPSLMEQQAVQLIQQGKLKEAEAIYRSLIAAGSESHTVYGNLAAICGMQRRFDELIGLLRKALELEPDFPEGHKNLGNALLEQGDVEAAISSFTRAIELKSDFLEAHLNLSFALKQQGRLQEAEAVLQALLSAGINHPSIYNHLAMICGTQGRFQEAAKLIEQLLALNPEDPSAHNNLGNVLKQQGNLPAATASYRRAIQLQANFPEAYSNLVLGLMQQGDLDPALQACQNGLAVEADPVNRQTFIRAQLKILLLLGREQEAESVVASQGESWQRNLLRLSLLPPLYRDAEHIKSVRRRYQRALRQLINQLEGPQRDPSWQPALEQYGISATAFYLAYQMEDDRSLQQLGCRLLRAIFTPRLAPLMEPLPARPRSEVLRLGVASHHLRNHNGAHWSLGWLEPLAADPRFELFTYQLDGESDSLTERFAALGQHRRFSLSLATIAACAQQIRADDLDVLLYPAIGMDPYTRVLSLLRLAPRQATGWGHPITSGSDAIDWFFSGDGMEPTRGQRHYSETLVRLPHTGLTVPPPDAAWLPGDRDAAALELPLERPLLFSAQTSFKYDPRHDSLLVEIASANPEALILLVDTPPELAGLGQRLLDRLQPRFSQAGLELHQHLRLLPRLNPREFIGLFRQVTLALDTPAWNGGNTSLQAFSQGCPVVTIPGRFMRGRHTLAMLQRMDIPELIARDHAEAVEIVSRLLADPQATSQLRQRILDRQSLLFNDTTVSDAFRDHLLRHWQ